MEFDSVVETRGKHFWIRIPDDVVKELHLSVGDPVHVQIAKTVDQVNGFGIAKGAKPFKRDPHDDFHF